MAITTGNLTVIINAPAAPSGELSVSKQDVTFTFTGEYEVGQDAAGDWWVYNSAGTETAIISAISPASEIINGVFNVVPGAAGSGTAYADRAINGAMLNPGALESGVSIAEFKFGSSQGWDTQPGTGNGVTYDAAKNVDPAATGLPITLTEGTILKAVSDLTIDPDGRSAITRYVPLTVVTTKPAANAIIAHPWTTAQALEFTTDDIDLSILPRLAVPTGQTRPDIAELTALMAFTRQYHWTQADNVRKIHPQEPFEDGLGYGGQSYYARLRGRVLMALTLDYSDPELLALATQVVREGIAIARRVETGGVWEANGGLNSGRLPILAATALLLNDANMLSMVDRNGSYGVWSNKQRWHEYGQIFTVGVETLYARTGIYEPGLFDLGATAGYAIGDKVRLTGGVSHDGTELEWEVNAVGSGGAITSADQLTLINNTRYHQTPTVVETVTGSGTGLAISPNRDTRIYNQGMIGVVEYGANPVATAFTDAPNSDIYDAYRKNNRAGNIGTLLALRQFSGVSALNIGETFDYHDRSFFMAGSGLSSEDFTPFEIAYWNDHRGYVDPAPGAPVVTEYGCKDNVVWIKYNKYLQEDPANGVPSANDFAVTVNGTPVTIRGLYMFGDSVSLYLASMTAQGDTVLVSYTKGTAPNVVKDWFNVEAAAFSSQSVTNYTTTYVNPAPDSIIPDADFMDLYNNSWGGAIRRVYDNTGNVSARFEAAEGSGTVLLSRRFPITGGASYDFSFMVSNLANGPANTRITLVYRDAGGTILSSPRLFGSTFNITANGLYGPGSVTADAGAVTCTVEIRKMTTGPSFWIDYINFEPA